MNEKLPKPSARSPLDVPGIKTDFSTKEVVDIVRKMRESARDLPKSESSTRSARRRTKPKGR
jgi:hypothetical protein